MSAQNPAVEDLLLQHYPEAQYIFVQFITDHLADCSRVFSGDLTEVMVLALIGQAYLNAHLVALKSGTGHQIEPTAAYWISATRIADICGLSRETVRRKLKKLEEKGWIAQNENSGWQIALKSDGSKARDDLLALDRRGIERLAKLYVQINSLIERQTRP